MDPTKIIGCHGNRVKNDFYPTPPECTQVLLEFLRAYHLLIPGETIWEPACGQNDMVKVMCEYGYNVIATDIQGGVDFLTAELPEGVDWIITNPPFKLAQDFIKRSVEMNKPFALLLKSQYWHSAKRRQLFYEHQPALVMPLTWRPDFTGSGASLLDVMWCVWLGKTTNTYYLPLRKPEKVKGGGKE